MIIGLIANPLSSKDVRRLVGLARVVDVEEKANLVARLLAGMAAGPALEVHALDDASGLVRRALRIARGRTPVVRFLPMEAAANAEDTRKAAELLRELGAAALVLVGGDGTVRAAVEGWPDAPLVPVAAGTNNAIALTEEPTVVGLATALATDPKVAGRAFSPIPCLLLEADGSQATAVVDVVGVRSPWAGSRALWEPDELVEAVVVSADPTAVGVASVAAGIGPIPAGCARHILFGSGRSVRAVFGPGLVLDLEVAHHRLLAQGEKIRLGTETRMVALDGERRVLTSGRPLVIVGSGPKRLYPAKALRA